MLAAKNDAAARKRLKAEGRESFSAKPQPKPFERSRADRAWLLWPLEGTAETHLLSEQQELFGASLNTTFSDGYLGSGTNEGRSETR